MCWCPGATGESGKGNWRLHVGLGILGQPFFSCRPHAVTRTMTRTFMIAQSLWEVRQLHQFTCNCLGPHSAAGSIITGITHDPCSSLSASLLTRLRITANTSTRPSMTCVRVTSPGYTKQERSSAIKTRDSTGRDEPRRGNTLQRRGGRLDA